MSRRGVPRYRRSPHQLPRPAPSPAAGPPPPKVGEYAHREAFMLMQYESDDGTERLTIWNSRDGVTPFECSHPETGTEVRHVRWGEDVRRVNYIPPVGSWIWTDTSEERALARAIEFVDRWWTDPDMPMHEHPHYNPTGAPSYDETAKRQAALIHAKATFEPGAPALVQVTEQHHADYSAALRSPEGGQNDGN